MKKAGAKQVAKWDYRGSRDIKYHCIKQVN